MVLEWQYLKKKTIKKANTKQFKNNTMAKKMNDYMVALNNARKSGAESFTYKGKTYKKAKTKTGMVIYKS